jgi:hypothetical protein
MSTKKSSTKNKTVNKGDETSLKSILLQIDNITKNAEEKILLENSIKSIIKGADNIAEHAKLLDKEKGKELIGIYNKIIDGLKQKMTTA